MNGQHKPRRARWGTGAVDRLASKLSNNERAAELAGAMSGFKALREGVANEFQWAMVVSALNMADGFELRVRPMGARGHIQDGQWALDAVMRRAMASGEWSTPTLFLQEIDDVRAALEFYEQRLRSCTLGEFRTVQAYARAEVESTGGVALNLKPASQAPAQQELLESL